ncbi:FRG domain-containing protein [Mycolicibacterium mucogenicum]|uniref:FRG domain-containing protein n=1 Tax=Mycolicibacterium mucogenicum TaxID=56689 RepID=UPI002269A588|nr:FRG domain-containing protein [Mycolicibacterium mucogenicum]MCX8559675.1 FRG domain-containing protein [Mycolicibacterium mucogenicum]
MDEITFSSLDQLVALVLEDKADDKMLWFRGHSSAAYKLIPKLLRDGTRTDKEIYRRESRLLARFRERSLPFWPSGYPQGPWEHLFSMQHYGIPTRLLDWSESLLVATYFSCSSPTSGSADSRPTVWTLDPIGWNQQIPQLQETGINVLTVADEIAERWEPVQSENHLGWRAKHPVAIYGVHNSTRIVAQRGTFTIAGEYQSAMEDIAVSEDRWKGLLKKYVFAGDAAELRSQLRFIGITESMVFPDLSSLSSELTELEGW